MCDVHALWELWTEEAMSALGHPGWSRDNPTNGLKQKKKNKQTNKNKKQIKDIFSNFVGSIFLNFGLWTLKSIIFYRKFEIYGKNHP